MDPKLTSVFDAMQLTEAAKLNTAKTEAITILQQQIHDQSLTIARLNSELAAVKNHSEDNEYLLWKPLHEIARLNPQFRKNYEDHMLDFVGWAASQKGFVELAVQLGLDKGLSRKEIMKLGLERKMDVLHNRNPQGNSANASEVGFMASRAGAYLERLAKEEREFKEQYEAYVNEGRIYHILDEMESSWNRTYKAWLPFALAGNKEAQFNVGRALEYGIGVNQDFSKATEWFEKAIEQNEPRSAYLLFLRFKEKKSREYNLEKARKYGNLAIELGDPRAAEAVQKLEDELASDERKKLESQLWKDASRVTPGADKSDLVERIRGKGYVWEHVAIALHTADYKFEREKFYEKGAFFASSKKAYLCVTIKNKTSTSIQINPMVLDYYERSQAKDFEIASQQARKYRLGLLSKGQVFQSFKIDRLDGWNFDVEVPASASV